MACWGGGWGGRGRDYRHGDPHQNKYSERKGRELVHTFPLIVLQMQLEGLDGFNVNISAES